MLDNPRSINLSPIHQRSNLFTELTLSVDIISVSVQVTIFLLNLYLWMNVFHSILVVGCLNAFLLFVLNYRDITSNPSLESDPLQAIVSESPIMEALNNPTQLYFGTWSL